MGKYLNNIDDCLLTTFSEVMRTHNYKLLLLSGEYDEKLASDAWLELYDQYNEAVNSKSTNIQFEIIKQIEIKKQEYTIIKNAIFLIIEVNKINFINQNEDIDIDKYIKIVNYYGYRIDKTKDLGDEVTRVLRQIENYKTKIEIDKKQLEKLNENSSDRTFLDTLTDVELFITFSIADNCNVRKFVSYLNKLVKSNSETKNKK